ncbi:rab-GTPase-TBC domain-containing protein [Pseudomassariella vexata]|uniref:Rab-GTPase-TBC domain-domain-containing protein n=1 Tax=Pseudomassariella vexata TaxID=1141098 RepID=A0A1Y2E200_9PEZI|nr:rab-GTPase-TBC domain-containing protein [Pseudomassariella vexata]ORY64895.1 rab-GTPase-TBC domain-domain-containing protein [Pseudomassariella vexata]
MTREGEGPGAEKPDDDGSSIISSARLTVTSRSSDVQSENDEDEASRAKSLVILDACNRRDIDDLKDLALSEGGFLSDTIRCQAWPVLLGLDTPNGVGEYNNQTSTLGGASTEPEHFESNFKNTNSGKGSWRELPRHRDEHQVCLDVERSFIYYPDHQSQAQLELKKTELSDLIVETLRRNPYLCYFQGYHDICQVFLLVLPVSLRAHAIARLSALRIRDFMLPNLAPAIAQLCLIPCILNAVDPSLYRHLSQTEPFFALSGTLTMYAHDIQSYGDIARLFDALLAREQVFSVYMFAQIVLNRREELFYTPANEPEMLHSILSKLPHPLRLQELIEETGNLFERHPPESLYAWPRVSKASVMKTARDVKTCAAQSMGDGERFFERQLRELQWADTREKMVRTFWMYRKPARGMALAIVVGVAAVYLRRSPGIWAYLAPWLRWT